MALFRKKETEFKPDATQATWLKTARLTRQQQLRLVKWVCYALTILLALVTQDVVMSQVSIFGATTELAVCVIMLITVIEGSEVGSLFVLIASLCYFYSGTAPGAYSIGLLCFLGIGVSLLRQMYLHRNKSSILLAAGTGVMVYELAIFLVGLLSGLTRMSRLGVFVLTGILNILVLIPLYSLIYKIGMIGGNTWKE